MPFALPVSGKIETQYGKSPAGRVPGDLTQNTGVPGTCKTMPQYNAHIIWLIRPVKCAGQIFSLKIMEANLLLHANFPIQAVPGCVETTP